MVATSRDAAGAAILLPDESDSMLHHWLIMVPKNAKAEDEVVARIDRMLSAHLCFKPRRAMFHRFPVGVYVLSVSENTEVWSMTWPFVLGNHGFLVVSGVPTLEAFAGGAAGGSIPERMQHAMRRHGIQRVYDSTGGTFSMGCLDLVDGVNTITAFGDFSGYGSCFFTNTSDYFAVGNRASFVGAARPGFPDVKEIDIDALSWTFGTTMIMGERTAFSGVRRLRPGSYLRISLEKNQYSVGRMKKIPFFPNHFTAVPRAAIDELDLDSVCSRLGDRIRWCKEEGVRFRAHLTGGRDTRVVAAILTNQGALDSVDRFSTTGTERNGDVMVARELAGHLGISDRHVVSAGGKREEQLTPVEVGNIILRSSFLYDCQLTPFDGRRSVVSRTVDFATLFGGGGEIYRQEWGSLALPIDGNLVQRVLNLFCRYDALSLLDDRAKRFHAEQIERELEWLKDAGARNLACAFYLEERFEQLGMRPLQQQPVCELPRCCLISNLLETSFQ